MKHYEMHLHLSPIPDVDGHEVTGTFLPLQGARQTGERTNVEDVQISTDAFQRALKAEMDAMTRDLERPVYPKYAVLKYEDFIRLTDPREPMVRTKRAKYRQRMLTDAVVIRKQDVLAPAGLYAYAHSARDRIDLMRELEMEVPDGLEAAAEYFADQAEDARVNGGSKLPD